MNRFNFRPLYSMGGIALCFGCCVSKTIGPYCTQEAPRIEETLWTVLAFGGSALLGRIDSGYFGVRSVLSLVDYDCDFLIGKSQLFHKYLCAVSV